MENDYLLIGIFNSIHVLVSSKSQKLIQQLAFSFWVPQKSGNHISSNKSMEVLSSSMPQWSHTGAISRRQSLGRHSRSGYMLSVTGSQSYSAPALCTFQGDCSIVLYIFRSLCPFEMNRSPWSFLLAFFRNYNYKTLKSNFMKYQRVTHFNKYVWSINNNL